MTSLEALECYSSYHPESFEVLLEWPYRRFLKAFSAWQRRNAVDEIEKRKNLHVSSLYANSNWDDERNNREEQIENLERYYEALKDMVWNPEMMKQENKEMQELEENDSFLRAGKRNLQKVVAPKFPGQDNFEEAINE